MKNVLIIIGLVFFGTSVLAQPVNNIQKRQLQNIGFKNQKKLQKRLKQSDRLMLNRMKNEADSVARIPSLKQRTRAIRSYNQKYSKFRSTLLKNANFNNDAYFQELKRALPQAKLKKGKHGYYAINKNVLQRKSPNVKVNPKFKMVTSPGKKVKTSTKKSNKASGFSSTNPSIKFEYEGCSGNNYNGQFRDNNGFSSFSSAAGAAGCETVKGTGNNVRVPQGVKRVRVKIILGDGFSLAATAMGALGYGHCQTEVGIRVKGAGMEEYFKDSDILCIAPVLYFAEVDAGEQDEYEMEASFVPAQAGGTYRIQAYGKTFSMGIAGGIGVGYTVVDEVTRVEVAFEY